jgi:hypothetical protein
VAAIDRRTRVPPRRTPPHHADMPQRPRAVITATTIITDPGDA